MVGRYFAYYLSTIVFLLGFIWVGFDARKQGWHDKLAGNAGHQLEVAPTQCSVDPAARRVCFETSARMRARSFVQYQSWSRR